MPGMVYLSQPTEYGTLYSKKELAAISALCREKRLPLYIDGARLAYALACPENDVTLRDLAALCDIFYIGGTKCGALLGEAVVIPQPGLIPHFFTIISSTARCSPRDGCSASSSTRSLPMGSTSASAQTPFATPTLSGARWRKMAICPVSPPRRTRASASSVSSSAKSSPSAWTSPSGSMRRDAQHHPLCHKLGDAGRGCERALSHPARVHRAGKGSVLKIKKELSPIFRRKLFLFHCAALSSFSSAVHPAAKAAA